MEDWPGSWVGRSPPLRPTDRAPTELRANPIHAHAETPEKQVSQAKFSSPAACGGGLKALVVTHAGCTRSINDPRSPRSARVKAPQAIFRDHELSNLKN